MRLCDRQYATVRCLRHIEQFTDQTTQPPTYAAVITPKIWKCFKLLRNSHNFVEYEKYSKKRESNVSLSCGAVVVKLKYEQLGSMGV
jgi:hypothetical protein